MMQGIERVGLVKSENIIQFNPLFDTFPPIVHWLCLDDFTLSQILFISRLIEISQTQFHVIY
jgi:hypothetical protein